MEKTLKDHHAVWLTPDHCVIRGEKPAWEIHVYKNVLYPDSETIFPWKVDTQFFSRDNWAAKYLLRLIEEKKTGIRKIYHERRTPPDICGIGGKACRSPGKCNTMLCTDCPVAEEFFAERDGVVLQYIPNGATDCSE